MSYGQSGRATQLVLALKHVHDFGGQQVQIPGTDAVLHQNHHIAEGFPLQLPPGLTEIVVGQNEQRYDRQRKGGDNQRKQFRPQGQEHHAPPAFRPATVFGTDSP